MTPGRRPRSAPPPPQDQRRTACSRWSPVDHRDSLGVAFEARGVAAPEGAAIAALKAEIVAALAPAATGVLIDAEHGAAVLADGAGGAPAVAMPLEAQGYADAESGRVTSFLPGWGPGAALAAGADACKLLLPFRADHAASAEAQIEVVGRGRRGLPRGGPPARARADRLPARGRGRGGPRRRVPRPRRRRRGAARAARRRHHEGAVPARRRRRAPRRSGAGSSMPPAARRRGCSSAAAPPTRRSPPRSRRRAGRARRATSSAAQPGRALSPPTPSERRRWLADVGAPRLRAVRERAAALARPFTSRVPALCRDTRRTGTVAPAARWVRREHAMWSRGGCCTWPLRS